MTEKTENKAVGFLATYIAALITVVGGFAVFVPLEYVITQAFYIWFTVLVAGLAGLSTIKIIEITEKAINK